MGNFFGTYERTLDEKRRLQIPSKLVKEMPSRFFVLRGFEGSLSVYEEDDFQKWLASLKNLSYLDPSARSYIRLAASSATELDVDSHGRITINADITAKYGIGNSVTIIGVLDHFEIWDSTKYAQYLSEKTGDFESLAGALAKRNEV